ncbi:MAG: hypothetical protein EZS28_017792 [Streblomastix strix]|uniref:Uncharacterized protein n=1 Tax=Streblomastix strix TaxID=222440 RepID=A0A5J4VVF1_9EUKA|nr:MAG: hypothetical protein EZS28_017792 [Streblomastix strix]
MDDNDNIIQYDEEDANIDEQQRKQKERRRIEGKRKKQKYSIDQQGRYIDEQGNIIEDEQLDEQQDKGIRIRMKERKEKKDYKEYKLNQYGQIVDEQGNILTEGEEDESDSINEERIDKRDGVNKGEYESEQRRIRMKERRQRRQINTMGRIDKDDSIHKARNNKEQSDNKDDEQQQGKQQGRHGKDNYKQQYQHQRKRRFVIDYNNNDHEQRRQQDNDEDEEDDEEEQIRLLNELKQEKLRLLHSTQFDKVNFLQRLETYEKQMRIKMKRLREDVEGERIKKLTLIMESIHHISEFEQKEEGILTLRQKGNDNIEDFNINTYTLRGGGIKISNQLDEKNDQRINKQVNEVQQEDIGQQITLQKRPLLHLNKVEPKPDHFMALKFINENIKQQQVSMTSILGQTPHNSIKLQLQLQNELLNSRQRKDNVVEEDERIINEGGTFNYLKKKQKYPNKSDQLSPLMIVNGQEEQIKQNDEEKQNIESGSIRDYQNTLRETKRIIDLMTQRRKEFEKEQEKLLDDPLNPLMHVSQMRQSFTNQEEQQQEQLNEQTNRSHTLHRPHLYPSVIKSPVELTQRSQSTNPANDQLLIGDFTLHKQKLKDEQLLRHNNTQIGSTLRGLDLVKQSSKGVFTLHRYNISKSQLLNSDKQEGGTIRSSVDGFTLRRNQINNEILNKYGISIPDIPDNDIQKKFQQDLFNPTQQLSSAQVIFQMLPPKKYGTLTRPRTGGKDNASQNKENNTLQHNIQGESITLTPRDASLYQKVNLQDI